MRHRGEGGYALRSCVRVDDSGELGDDLGGVRREGVAEHLCHLFQELEDLEKEASVPVDKHHLHQLWDPRLQVGVHCRHERWKLLHEVVEHLWSCGPAQIGRSSHRSCPCQGGWLVAKRRGGGGKSAARCGRWSL